jgi:hypothetical protein
MRAVDDTITICAGHRPILERGVTELLWELLT